jgi:hypothetical protein
MMAKPHDREARTVLLNWINQTLKEKGWRAYNWTLAAELSDTSLTRFLKNPATAHLPSATTLIALAHAAESNPNLLEAKKLELGKKLPLLDGKLLTLMASCSADLDGLTIRQEIEQLTERRTTVVSYDTSTRAFALECETRSMNAAGLLPGDHLICEPPEIVPPRVGDTVITLSSSGEVQPLRYAGDWLKPVSTDTECEPVLLAETRVYGTVVQMSRPMRPMDPPKDKVNGKETTQLIGIKTVGLLPTD